LVNSDPRRNLRAPVSAEERLLAAGIVVPAARAPIANFVGGVREGELLFLSGQGPVTSEGRKTGKVGRDVSGDEAYAHARIAGLNLLSQMRAILGSLDHVARIVKVLGMVNAADDFIGHPAVIDGCSDLLIEVFGEQGRHARSAVGVSSLPGGISVEVEAVVAVRPGDLMSSNRPA
jgi:enamine deaminase RidA (YjgF/YER057c/UK114 family)